MARVIAESKADDEWPKPRALDQKKGKEGRKCDKCDLEEVVI